MSGPLLHWTLILVAAASNVILNLSLKALAKGIVPGPPLGMIWAFVVSPWTWLSAVSGTLLVGAFALAIRSFSLSLTYTAITAIAMVALTLIGVMTQTETLGMGRAVGLAMIVSGLLVTAWATT